MKKGYSLIEILVVMSIVAVISIFGLNFLSTILKGTSKSTITSELKQNGNYVMDVMSYYIRNAVTIEQCLSNSITLRQWDNTSVVFSLLAKDDVNKINARIASNSAALTNSDAQSGIAVSSLSFTCSSTAPPVVTLSFTLSQSAWASNTTENTASLNFSTTVSLRTY